MNVEDGGQQRGALLSANASPVQYRLRDRDLRLDPDESHVDSSRLDRVERAFSQDKPGRTRDSGFEFDELEKEDHRYPDTVRAQNCLTNENVASSSRGRHERPADTNRWPLSFVERQ